MRRLPLGREAAAAALARARREHHILRLRAVLEEARNLGEHTRGVGELVDALAYDHARAAVRASMEWLHA